MNQDRKAIVVAILITLLVIIAFIGSLYLAEHRSTNGSQSESSDKSQSESPDSYVGNWKITLANDIFMDTNWGSLNIGRFTLEKKSEPYGIPKELKLFKENAPLVIPLSIKDKAGRKIKAGVYSSKFGHVISFWVRAGRWDSFIRLEGDKLYWGAWKNAANINIYLKGLHLNQEKIADGINVLWIPYKRSDE